MTQTSAQPRRALFLQGPPTRFWKELASAFRTAGHETFRVNLCTADRMFWGAGGDDYRGRLSNWGDWIGEYLETHGITDVLYYADRLPYHVIARAQGEARGVNVHAIEFGYLRPDRLTLERGGMGAFSHFPNDPDVIRAIARDLPPRGETRGHHAHNFVAEAVADMAANLVNAIFAWPYPFYVMDKPQHPIIEYPAWLPRLLRGDVRERAAQAVTAKCEADAWPYTLVALQLSFDYQIRDNSHFRDMGEMIEATVASFARHAAPERRLIFKLHPLDNGHDGWPNVIERAARAHGVADRVIWVDGGRLDVMIRHADGVVTTNSTVGPTAIRSGRPVLALGKAVYDMPGLTHQGPTAAFWETPEPVDRELAEAFRAVLEATVQVRGSFYEETGRAAAQAEIVRRVAGGLVNEPDAFVPAPPRLPVTPRAADAAQA